MSIQELLGEIPQSVFVEQHFSKLPFALSNSCLKFCELGSWAIVERILRQNKVDALVVRGGERWSANRVPAFEEARSLHIEGYTLVIRHAERHDEGLRSLADGFAADFAAPVDVHLYCTPAGQFGFGWHYDAEDVFILQTQGEKRYSLRKNTVNPWPVVEIIPDNLGYEREIMPLMNCTLTAGDWLYIPAGYWHRADSSQDSISLAVGVMSSTALDLFDHLRTQLVQSLVWRQRLPVPGTAGNSRHQLLETYQELCRELSRDLTLQLENAALLESFFESRTRMAKLEPSHVNDPPSSGPSANAAAI